MHPIRLLHITDLHFSAEGQPEPVDNKAGEEGVARYLRGDASDRFIGRLRKRFETLPREAWPKAVIVTGDLVNAGGGEAGEMEAARKFLETLADRLELTKNRVLIVPGNHDVHWKSGLSMKERFENFLEAFGSFTTIAADENGPLPDFEELNLSDGVKLQIVLLVSPTFSGVPNPDAGRVFKQIEAVLSDWGKEELEKLRAALRQATGNVDIAAIGENQIQFINKTMARLGKEPEVVRIACLHHHLLPDPQLTVSTFETVLDAGRALETLLDNEFDLVLSGHKHNRRLVHYSLLEQANARTIDVFNGPSLFKGSDSSPSGFTLIEFFGPDSPNYATLEFCETRSAQPQSRRELMREGRVIGSVIKTSSHIAAKDQEDLVVPVLESASKVSKWLQRDRMEEGDIAPLIERAWETLANELAGMGERELIFRQPDLHVRWGELLALAQKTRRAQLLLASADDIAFWWKAMTVKNSEAAQYEAHVRNFHGKKERILILNRYELSLPEKRDQADKIAAWMETGNISVSAILSSNAPAGDMDFGVIGDLAVSQFRGRGIDSRSLLENFAEDDVRSFTQRWKELRGAPDVWSSDLGPFGEWL
jgi:3',5'-cyclic AMP phosphodiesterase CpdA